VKKFLRLTIFYILQTRENEWKGRPSFGKTFSSSSAGGVKSYEEDERKEKLAAKSTEVFPFINFLIFEIRKQHLFLGTCYNSKALPFRVFHVIYTMT
jgi:hypothetical protein